jgi:hypothetical protein
MMSAITRHPPFHQAQNRRQSGFFAKNPLGGLNRQSPLRDKASQSTRSRPRQIPCHGKSLERPRGIALPFGLDCEVNFKLKHVALWSEEGIKRPDVRHIFLALQYFLCTMDRVLAIF